MGYSRNDGNYKIYIIKHLWKDKPENSWADSGECCQWIPKEIARRFHDDLVFGKGVFVPFTANGQCWQRTGIHGSFVKEDAIKILKRIANWNPDHRFKVCKLLLNQVTEDILEMKYAIVP